MSASRVSAAEMVAWMIKTRIKELRGVELSETESSVLAIQIVNYMKERLDS